MEATSNTPEVNQAAASVTATSSATSAVAGVPVIPVPTTGKLTSVAIVPGQLQQAAPILARLIGHAETIQRLTVGNLDNDLKAARLMAADDDVKALAEDALELHALLVGTEAASQTVNAKLETLGEAAVTKEETVGTNTTLEGELRVSDGLRGKGSIYVPHMETAAGKAEKAKADTQAAAMEAIAKAKTDESAS